MKTFIYCLVSFCMISVNAFAQNWITTGGNLQKNGINKLTGPVTQNLYWSVNSTNSTLWGNSVFTWGNKFVTSRVTFTPSYRSKLELRNLTNGALIWEEQIADTSIMYAVGFNEDAVYANDYKTGRLYALNISDGSVKWSISSGMFGGNTGVLFASNGDVITFGKRINKLNGNVVWTNNYIIPVGPDESYCIYGNTYYHWTGSIVTPKKLIAIDLTTGVTKYTSQDLPGDGDQENDIIVGPGGTIYITRDGGFLYAFSDNGTTFQLLWSHPKEITVKGFAKDGTVYGQTLVGRLVRINPANGNIIDSTASTYGSPLYTRISVGADSTVYLNTGETGAGRYVSLVPNLQNEKWSFNAPYNYYSSPGLGKEGVMVLAGSGSTITAYKTALNNLKPVADFYAANNIITQFSSTNFFDLSSYTPTGWQWTFQGAQTTTSTQQSPVNITYNNEGVYNVTLTASNAFGQDTLVRSSYIVVLPFIGIRQIGNEVPSVYKLYQNYPNPFNPSTKIRFDVPNSTFGEAIAVNIYDVSGRKVEQILNEKMNPGTYELQWSAANYSSGIYFFTLSSSAYNETRKMILIK